MLECNFVDLNIEDIKNYLFFLDIDGTIVEDGGQALSNEVIEKIIKLKKNNQIYFCSNKKDWNRQLKICAFTGVECLRVPHSKPNRKILNYIKNDKNLPLLVIGDKFLTDGLFAKNIGAKFIKVKRIVFPKDRWYIKLIYLIDDICYRLIKI